MTEPTELYRKHRPRLFKDVIGQPGAVKLLKTFCDKGTIPHALLFTGPSGCGKTTLARIVAAKLKCAPTDFKEINAASSRGIDTIREIEERRTLRGFSGGARVIYLDEGHQLTREAQNGMLKLLEEPPPHLFFMIASSEPAKLIRAIITRCTVVECAALSPADLEATIKAVLTKEGAALPPAVLARLVECCEGSARKALVDLEKCLQYREEREQLACIVKPADDKTADELVKVLLDKGATWAKVAALVRGYEGDYEGLRRRILGYAGAFLLNGGERSPRAYAILQAFRDHWFDCGKAGLIMSCFEVFGRK